MIKVKVSTTGLDIPFIFLSPNSMGIWEDCKFYINEDVEEVDWWIVMENLEKQESTKCPRENIILVAMENEFMKQYNNKFLKQFHSVITCHRKMKHPNKVLYHQGHFSHLFWSRKKLGQSLEDFHKQFKTYDELKAMEKIPKTKLISVITSSKVRTTGQRLRNQFIKKAKEYFGDRLDAYSEKPNVFGPDTKVDPIKWNAIAPYKYYLALENSSVPHYWTSNISDAHLAGAYPFYYGHPSVSLYYPQSMYTPIDINKPKEAFEIIESKIAQDYYETHIGDIWKARDLWLDNYSLFPMLRGIVKRLPSGKTSTKITLRPEKKIFLRNKVSDRLKKYPFFKNIARKTFRTYSSLPTFLF